MKKKLIISSLSVLILENTGATISSTVYTPVYRGGRQNFETVQNC